MAVTGQCAICGNPAEHVGDQYIPAWRCPRCGSAEYHATVGWVPVETAEHRLQLAAWVREQNVAGIEFPNITPEISRVLAHRRIPGLRERADRALAVIARKYPDLKQPTPFEGMAKDMELLGFTYSENASDAMVLIEVLLDDGCLRGFKNTVTNQAPDGVITVKGMLAAEALGKSASNSPQGFVAMSFDASLWDAWTNGFHPAIREAGFSPLRLDDKEYVGGISDEIISEIRRSRFVVADYTNQVNGVYFEAGFALGLGLTVIPTCRSDEFDKLHFDIRHLNTLKWSDPNNLADSLSKRIRAVVGVGPNFQTS